MSRSTCANCGGTLRPWLPVVKDPQTGDFFTIVRCANCGLGKTRPSPDDLAYYYGPSYHGGRHGITALWCAHRRLHWVKSLAGAGTGRRLLDIGCGDGTFLLAAARAGWQVVGTEFNPESARRSGLDVRSDLVEVDDGALYDCITSWHSLEHMRDPNKVVAALRRLLAPRGSLIIAVPDAGGLQARVFSRYWLHLDVPRHLYHFNLSSIKTLLSSSGFTIVSTRHQEFEYDLLGWSQSALNTLTPIPNIFFAVLSGRPATTSRPWLCLSLVLGVIFSCIALPLVLLGSAIRRGGTLVVMARPKLEDD